MFGLGIPELVVILVIILIVFGVGKLPQIGEGMGKAIKGFRKGMNESEDGSKKDSDQDVDPPSSRLKP